LRHLAVALAITVAAFVAAPAEPARAASTAKVVIVVGADTPQYLDDADQLYAEAIRHTPNVVRVYSPNATWSAVSAAAVGANVLIYLGHGNGWPSPYTYDPKYTTKDGFGLNATAAGTHGNLKYYGEPWIWGAPGYGPGLRLAPGAIVFLHHLCYASGNSEPGMPAPTLDVARQRADNYASAFLKAGASAVIADGHSHDPYYLRTLFTTGMTLDALWRGAPNFHDHVLGFAGVRSSGMVQLDPDQAGAGFYRSISGDPSTTTWRVVNGSPPRIKLVLEGRVSSADATMSMPTAGIRRASAVGPTTTRRSTITATTSATETSTSTSATTAPVVRRTSTSTVSTGTTR
jgi:hypothetical protein